MQLWIFRSYFFIFSAPDSARTPVVNNSHGLHVVKMISIKQAGLL